MEHQACPFCGGEMRPGGMYLSLRLQHADPIRWVPLEGGFYAPWDADGAVTLNGTLEAQAADRPLAEQLFASFPQAEAWYCPACEKAVAVFQKAEFFADPFPNVSNGLFPTEAEVMASLREDKPGGKAEPAPEPRPRPRRRRPERPPEVPEPPRPPQPERTP